MDEKRLLALVDLKMAIGEVYFVLKSLEQAIQRLLEVEIEVRATCKEEV